MLWALCMLCASRGMGGGYQGPEMRGETGLGRGGWDHGAEMRGETGLGRGMGMVRNLSFWLGLVGELRVELRLRWCAMRPFWEAWLRMLDGLLVLGRGNFASSRSRRSWLCASESESESEESERMLFCCRLEEEKTDLREVRVALLESL